jgi:UDP-N-acetylmuramate--alanine ligase
MNIFFSGIGGVGIGPLAEMSLDAGYTVQGSDQQETPFTRILAEHGVSISLDQDGKFLQTCHENTPIDWFVHTSALPPDHPEITKARELGIKVAKRDALLAHIIKERNLKLIAIAGTHGKTTTTSMLVWTLRQLDIPISYSVGTTFSFGPSGAYQEGSEYFVYECDEYDRNFLQFFPYLSLIPSLDYDHPDTYPTQEGYLEAFRRFAHQSNHMIMWQTDDSNISSSAKSSWVLQSNEAVPLKLIGAHNQRNATLVLKALEYLHIRGREEAESILERFPGTRRRFEKVAHNLYTDYAIHPKEIATTLKMARELSDHVVAVYQPHQNVRQYALKDMYDGCFELAEEVYWLPTYLSREDPNLATLIPKELTEDIDHPRLHLADLNGDLWTVVEAARDKGKLIVFMGAGSIDAWLRQQLAV